MAAVEVADTLPTTANEDQGLVHEVTSKGPIVEDTETEVLDKDASRETAGEVAKQSVSDDVLLNDGVHSAAETNGHVSENSNILKDVATGEPIAGLEVSTEYTSVPVKEDVEEPKEVDVDTEREQDQVANNSGLEEGNGQPAELQRGPETELAMTEDATTDPRESVSVEESGDVSHVKSDSTNAPTSEEFNGTDSEAEQSQVDLVQASPSDVLHETLEEIAEPELSPAGDVTGSISNDDTQVVGEVHAECEADLLGAEEVSKPSSSLESPTTEDPEDFSHIQVIDESSEIKGNLPVETLATASEGPAGETISVVPVVDGDDQPSTDVAIPESLASVTDNDEAVSALEGGSASNSGDIEDNTTPIENLHMGQNSVVDEDGQTSAEADILEPVVSSELTNVSIRVEARADGDSPSDENDSTVAADDSGATSQDLVGEVVTIAPVVDNDNGDSAESVSTEYPALATDDLEAASVTSAFDDLKNEIAISREADDLASQDAPVSPTGDETHMQAQLAEPAPESQVSADNTTPVEADVEAVVTLQETGKALISESQPPAEIEVVTVPVEHTLSETEVVNGQIDLDETVEDTATSEDARLEKELDAQRDIPANMSAFESAISQVENMVPVVDDSPEIPEIETSANVEIDQVVEDPPIPPELSSTQESTESTELAETVDTMQVEEPTQPSVHVEPLVEESSAQVEILSEENVDTTTGPESLAPENQPVPSSDLKETLPASGMTEGRSAVDAVSQVEEINVQPSPQESNIESLDVTAPPEESVSEPGPGVPTNVEEQSFSQLAKEIIVPTEVSSTDGSLQSNTHEKLAVEDDVESSHIPTILTDDSQLNQTDDQAIADPAGVERSNSPSWTQSYSVQNQGHSQVEAESNSILSKSEIEPDTTTIPPGSEGSVPPALETQSDVPADAPVEGGSTQEIASQTNVEPSSQESGIALLDVTTPPRVEELVSELTGKEALSPPVVEAAVRTEEFSTAPIIVTEDSQLDQNDNSSAVYHVDIEPPKSPSWAQSYSVQNQGPGTSQAQSDETGAEPEIIPSAESVTSHESPSTSHVEAWTPSYSVSRQGSPRPESKPLAEDAVPDSFEDIQITKDELAPGNDQKIVEVDPGANDSDKMVIDNTPDIAKQESEQGPSDLSEVCTADLPKDDAISNTVINVSSNLDVKDAIERPKSPWTPSYSVTSQGSGVVNEEDIPQIALPATAQVDAVPTTETEVSEEAIKTATSHSTLPWASSYSASVQGGLKSDTEGLPEAQKASKGENSDAPQNNVFKDIQDSASDIPPSEDSTGTVAPVIEDQKVLPESGIQPDESTPVLDVQVVPETESQFIAPVSTENLQGPEAIERPKSPWTPSYSVTQQGSAETPVDGSEQRDNAVNEPIEAAIDLPSPKNDERPWTPSYSVFSLPGASTKAEGSSHEEASLEDDANQDPATEVPTAPKTVDESPENKPAFPTAQDNGSQESLTSLDTVEPKDSKSRARLESTTSSLFFPGGWFSRPPPATLDTAQGQGVFTPSKSTDAPESPTKVSSSETAAATPDDGAEVEAAAEKKSRWCIVM
ncbi:hypothetical protein VKT23_011414 [Stygiomarasmius scandens]|uniref:Uncharacterized protein n=1 Tax=Marasmiellus scandens TaxID=2682957 RepID=A0ABR1JE25_9AGAR